jgi:hypothetical protein
MRVVAYLTLIVLATILAFWRGTPGERWSTSIVLLGSLLTMLIVKSQAHSFASVSVIFMLLDALVAALLCIVAVKHPAWVTILVSAFQINATFGHIVKLIAPDTIPFSYAFLLRVWAWPMVITMLISRTSPPLRAILRARDWPPFARRRTAA